MNLEFFHEMLAVGLDRLDAEGEFRSNLFVGRTFGYTLQHLGLAGAQAIPDGVAQTIPFCAPHP